jgi:hypothetical protein
LNFIGIGNRNFRKPLQCLGYREYSRSIKLNVNMHFVLPYSIKNVQIVDKVKNFSQSRFINDVVTFFSTERDNAHLL